MTVPKMVDGPGTDLPVFSPVCSTCRHLHWGEARACDAFPEANSIPLEIWVGHNDHCAPFPGDHGIQYERISSEEALRRRDGRRRALGPRPDRSKQTRRSRRSA